MRGCVDAVSGKPNEGNTLNFTIATRGPLNGGYSLSSESGLGSELCGARNTQYLPNIVLESKTPAAFPPLPQTTAPSPTPPAQSFPHRTTVQSRSLHAARAGASQTSAQDFSDRAPNHSALSSPQ